MTLSAPCSDTGEDTEGGPERGFVVSIAVEDQVRAAGTRHVSGERGDV